MMQSKALTVQQYINDLPEERKIAIKAIRKVIKENLPPGFQEVMSYGMIGYVVPHSLYPKGYHCDPSLPLPFMCIASQKNFISLYHMGIYSDKNLLAWFISEYEKNVPTKLDMGKSCIRFKKPEHIPIKLMGELSGKLTVDDWVAIYESNLKH